MFNFKSLILSLVSNKLIFVVATTVVQQFSFIGNPSFNKASKILSYITFADWETLFQIANQELINIHEWFKANKLSLSTSVK